jgi:glutamate N-acetyltransferase/amino-acid N-acetyltransferase
MSKTVSPLAPQTFATLPAIDGVRIATAEAGIRYKNRTDVLYVTLPKDTTVAGVFTRSKCPSAPVDWCRKNLGKGTARALVVNSGNANAFTGKKGAEAVKLTADIAAEAAGCRASQVFIASTGVIGEPLDAAKFQGVLAACEKKAKPTAWLDAAKAIMTTDTFPKVATRKATIGGVDPNKVGRTNK